MSTHDMGWRYEYDDARLGWMIYARENERKVAFVSDPERTEEEDARRIAAAPDMFAALEESRAALDKLIHYAALHGEMDPHRNVSLAAGHKARDAARAALSKARGEASK